MLAGVLLQPWQLQSTHIWPALKHSQYSLRHCVFLQLHLVFLGGLHPCQPSECEHWHINSQYRLRYCVFLQLHLVFLGGLHHCQLSEREHWYSMVPALLFKVQDFGCKVKHCILLQVC